MPEAAPAGCPTLACPAPRRGPRRRAWLAALFAAGLPWSSGCAAPEPPRAGVDGRWLMLEVVDRDDEQALRIWRHGGDAWVAGAPGERYAVRVTNRSGERLLAVVSVDGVNILTGETASARQRGYVLAPWQSTLLAGWRKSDSEVAAFEFTRLPQSYAALTGRPGDVGVIGVAVFREVPRPIAVDSERRRADATPISAGRDQGPVSPAAPAAPATPATPVPPGPLADGSRAADSRSQPPAEPANSGSPAKAPAMSATAPPGANADSAKDAAAPSALARSRAPAAERLGTGHGARESSWVTMVPFERAATPEELLHLRYDRLDNLVAAGIVPRSFASVTTPRPRAFPADGDANGFVPDPPSR